MSYKLAIPVPRGFLIALRPCFPACCGTLTVGSPTVQSEAHVDLSEESIHLAHLSLIFRTVGLRYLRDAYASFRSKPLPSTAHRELFIAVSETRKEGSEIE